MVSMSLSRQPVANDLSLEILENRKAVSEFIARAAAVEPDCWNRMRAPGKWTPAQEAEHIALTYETLTAEFRKSGGMRVVTPSWSHALMRWTLVPYILRTGKFPPGARSPRELRPASVKLLQGELLERLRAASEKFVEEWLMASRETPHLRLKHAFFGEIGLAQGIRLVIVHTRHHTDFLPPVRKPGSRTG